MAGLSSADDWDPQMLFFLSKGFRVIAADRRGHGRSTQTGDGHDMDHYADDLEAVTESSRLEGCDSRWHIRPAAVRWCTTSRVTATRTWPRRRSSAGAASDGEDSCESVGPTEVRVRRSPSPARCQSGASSITTCRPVRSTASTVPGVKTIEPVIWNWWRQSMMGGAKAGYDGIVAFSQTDFTEDLKKINVPVLVDARRGRSDRAVCRPRVHSRPNSLKNGTLKTYKDFPHGMITTQTTSSTPTCSRSSKANCLSQSLIDELENDGGADR